MGPVKNIPGGHPKTAVIYLTLVLCDVGKHRFDGKVNEVSRKIELSIEYH